MLHKFLTGLLFILVSALAWSTPKSIEVWFLSIDKTGFIESILDEKILAPFVTQSSLQCQQMGDYCFDPQVGLYKKDNNQNENSAETIHTVDSSELEKNNKYEFLAPHRGVEREMIECDENSNFFDIFCGKDQKRKVQNNSKFEIWVDVSSTMKQVDFDGFEKQCHRERFLKSLSNSCKTFGGVNIFFFEEFRKQAGMLDRVCMSSGLNEMKNIIRDLKQSKADHVLIITDIFEAQESFIDAIENLGVSSFKGLKTPFYAINMKENLKRLEKFCR